MFRLGPVLLIFFTCSRSSIESAPDLPEQTEPDQTDLDRQSLLNQRRESVLESFEKNQVQIQFSL